MSLCKYGKCLILLVHLKGETSNEIFEAFEDWDHQLRHINFTKSDDEIGGPKL